MYYRRGSKWYEVGERLQIKNGTGIKGEVFKMQHKSSQILQSRVR